MLQQLACTAEPGHATPNRGFGPGKPTACLDPCFAESRVSDGNPRDEQVGVSSIDVVHKVADRGRPAIAKREMLIVIGKRLSWQIPAGSVASAAKLLLF